jgi:hypothetical protein
MPAGRLAGALLEIKNIKNEVFADCALKENNILENASQEVKTP